MLSTEDNELLSRVGPGTPMGALIRRYWIPACLSTELPTPDSDPLRVRLLGENLIAFRDTNGQVGLLGNHCPHRGASLFFGRNEEAGLRCVYHGWKFDVTGQCVDMPNEPAESNFKSKVRATAYPTHESGGVVWTYMGPPDKQLPFRDFGCDSLPQEQWRAAKTHSSCNWVQAMEGNLDTVHISFLHRNLDDKDTPDDGTDQPGYPTVQQSARLRSIAKQPHLEVLDTPYGYRYAGIRETPNGNSHVRMTVFAMPFMTFVAALPLGGGCGMFVPIDDENCWRYQVAMHASAGVAGAGRQARPVPTAPSKVPGLNERMVFPENDYLIDRELQRTGNYTGILGVNQQDLAMTESMGSIFDRSTEHLGQTDLAIIRMRQQLIKAARELAQGVEPPGLDPTYPYQDIRSSEKILAPGEHWGAMATMDDPTFADAVAMPR
ncbi:MAG TPA: Rieske 2Fe-2S domain-containing protein [Chloroflexota bacterium]|nr:Rieske 2Fe-2S domain-containing protein [Chloroflexota bacterium]